MLVYYFGDVCCCWSMDCILLSVFGEDFVDGVGSWSIVAKDNVMIYFSGKMFSVWNKWCLTMLHNVDWKLYTSSYNLSYFSGKTFSVESNDVLVCYIMLIGKYTLFLTTFIL